jgi:hypothetical protein
MSKATTNQSEVSDKDAQKFTDAVDRFIENDIGKNEGAVTRIANNLVKRYGLTVTRDFILFTLQLYLLESPACVYRKYLYRRFNPIPGNIIVINPFHKILGWYDVDSQVIAVPLPLHRQEPDQYDYSEIDPESPWLRIKSKRFRPGIMEVNLYGFNKNCELWHSRGFAAAVEIPYTRHEKCELLDTRIEVHTNYIEEGFMKACKWWKGCKDWYRLRDSDYYVEGDTFERELCHGDTPRWQDSQLSIDFQSI